VKLAALWLAPLDQAQRPAKNLERLAQTLRYQSMQASSPRRGKGRMKSISAKGEPNGDG